MKNTHTVNGIFHFDAGHALLRRIMEEASQKYDVSQQVYEWTASNNNRQVILFLRKDLLLNWAADLS